MRFGFTTGSCAAAASKAGAFMLLTGKIKRAIKIETPKGITFDAEIIDIVRAENSVSCAVIKDGGDDPDVTTGAHVVSAVSFLPETDGKPYVKIKGGFGVGRVTKPGLDQPVGEAAINHVPREMIEKEVLEVCNVCDFHSGILIEISVPEGEALASKTFNPRLGIEGGISILGTSGIVEPMSSQALLDTIRVELNQKKALGYKAVAVTPGNYGQEFMLKTFGYDLDRSVKCSNFIGDTIDMAAELGFDKLLLTGHIGKLVKVSGGIMNTHSKEGDCRMELLAAAAVKAGCGLSTIKSVLDCVVTEEALAHIKSENKLEQVMQHIIERIMFFLEKRGGGKLEIGCMVYSNQFGLLAKSANADSLLEQCKEEES